MSSRPIELCFCAYVVKHLNVCECLFSNPLFSPIQFTAENTKAQKYLIRGLELTIKLFPNELLPRVAPILKIFYDLDILDEKVIIDWSSKVINRTLPPPLAVTSFSYLLPPI